MTPATTTPDRQVLAIGPVLRVGVVARDRWRAVTVMAAVGLIAAALMARFGMPPVDLHGPTHRWGLMMPTCGLTRGVAAAARLQFGVAVAYNPASIALVAGAVVVVARAVGGVLTGRWLDARVGDGRYWWAIGTVIFVVLWVNQQSHAALLMTP